MTGDSPDCCCPPPGAQVEAPHCPQSRTRGSRVRRGTSIAVAAVGLVSLVGFAVALTRVDSAFAGRAYAAYGGIYIAASLVWLWLLEGQRPTPTDLVGAALAIAGALIIISFAVKAP